MKRFFLFILRIYKRWLERRIDPENYDLHLSRKLDCITFLLEENDAMP